MNEENNKGSGDIQMELDELMEQVPAEETQEPNEQRAESVEEEPKTSNTEEAKEEVVQSKEVDEEESEQPAEVVEEPTEPEPSKEVKETKVSEDSTSNTQESDGVDYQAQNEELRKQLEIMAKATNSGDSTPNVSPPTSDAPKDEPVKPTPQQTPSNNNVIQFIDDKGFEDVMSDKDKLNNLLNKVYNVAVQNAYKNTPKMVDNMIRQRTYLNDKVDVFYKENDDLLPYRQFVGFVANEVSSQNPDWELDQVFEKVAVDVRTRLGLKKKIIDKAQQANTQPAFAQAKKSNSRDKADMPDLTEMEQQIQDLL